MNPDYIQIGFDQAHRYRWREVSGANGRILSATSQGYSRRIDMAANLERTLGGRIQWLVIRLGRTGKVARLIRHDGSATEIYFTEDYS